MANTHSELSRIAVLMQTGKSAPGFPGWTRPWLQAVTGSQAGRVGVAASGVGQAAPLWMRNLKAGQEVLAREFTHDLTRYPGQVDETWTYTIDFDINGEDSTFCWRVAWSTLYRASHRGYDQGAEPVNLSISGLTVTSMDGSVTTYLAGRKVMNGKDWGGTSPGHRSGLDGGTIYHGKPIRSAVMVLTYYGGHGQYHDTGDRSEWTVAPDFDINSTVSLANMKYSQDLLTNHWDNPQPKKVTDLYRRYRIQDTTAGIKTPYAQWPGNATITKPIVPMLLKIVTSYHSHTVGLDSADHGSHLYYHTAGEGKVTSGERSWTFSCGFNVYGDRRRLVYYGPDAGPNATARNVSTGQLITLSYSGAGSSPGYHCRFNDILADGTWEMRML